MLGLVSDLIVCNGQRMGTRYGRRGSCSGFTSSSRRSCLCSTTYRQPFPSTWRVHNQLQLISDNEALDAHVSVKAAFRFGMLEAFKVIQMFSLVLQLNSVAAVAMKRYARLASRFADGRRQGT